MQCRAVYSGNQVHMIIDRIHRLYSVVQYLTSRLFSSSHYHESTEEVRSQRREITLLNQVKMNPFLREVF